MTSNAFDLLVVGHGIAGLSAALSAMQNGAKVAVLERAPVEEAGGCTRYTEAYLRLKSEDELSDDFEGVLADAGSANPDPALVAAMMRPAGEWPGILRTMSVTDPEFISTFAGKAIPTIKWLKTFGIRFIPARLPHITGREHPGLVVPVGGGYAMMEALVNAGRAGGVAFYYETAVRRLLQDEAGAVVGVHAVARQNRPVEFRAKAVVLASGGFEGNPQMLQRYVGKGAINIRPVARGCYYNQGDGIRMACAIGAAQSGDYGYYHAVPVDSRSGRTEAKVLIFPFGIVVNNLGKRFTDEGVGTEYRTFDAMCHAIQAQPNGTGYAIVDAKINDIPEFTKAILSDRPPIEAASLAEMAQKLAIPAAALEETVRAFNGACRPGRFIEMRADGLATAGIEPKKSNWARPIDRAPFLCYPLIPASIITMGGIKTNANAQVLNAEGDCIPGLYAAGAVVGIFYRHYPAATSVLRGAVFGCIAGAHAAAKFEAERCEARTTTTA
ncbi:MAG: FAD-dependent oxidoreductase [Burkholderiales bacterium]|nr:FAD-dependent oxidoreductase [Burkholderiales bacterium]